MKKILLLLVIVFLASGISAQQLSYRFVNPRIIRLSAVDHLQFDVQIKCNTPGTYLWLSSIYLQFNNSAFNNDALNWSVVKLGDFAALNSQFGFKYNLVKSITGTAPNKLFNMTLHGDVNVQGNGPNPDDFTEVPTDWTSIVTIRARFIPPVSGDLLAGISFVPASMNGTQQYITGAPAYTLYTNPNIYDSRDFAADYTGRIYSSLYGWSQIGGTVNNTQFLDWASNVSTTVWEGSAAITQLDEDPAKIKNLLIKNGAILTVPTKKWLTVSGNLTISGGTSYNNLIIESGGSLLNSSGGVSATVKRDVSAWGVPWHGWHLLSSPVASQAIDPAFTAIPSSNYDFYAWNEPSLQWVNYKNTLTPPVWTDANVLNVNGSTVQGGLNFIPGKGYLVNYAAVAAGTKTFTGTLNKDNLVISNLSIKPGTTDKGWHLLGNPFTSALTWGTNWNLTNIISTTKIWKESTAAYVDIAPGGFIPALNGFMIQVTPAFGGNNSLTIPAAERVHNATAWYKSSTDPSIALVANDAAGQTAQESILQFNGAATTGFDPEFDSHFLTGYAPQFYSVAGDDQLSTNTLPDLSGTIMVPFDFIKNDGVNFTIEATTIANVTGPVLLNDLKTNASQDLTMNPVYSFTSESGDLPGRFLLTFSHVGIGENTNGSNGIYTWEKTLYISNPGRATLELFNLSGQKLLTEEINTTGMYKTTPYLPTAYYVVRLITGSKVVVAKVFLR